MTTQSAPRLQENGHNRRGFAWRALLVLVLSCLTSLLAPGWSAPQASRSTAASQELRQQARAALAQTSGRVEAAGLQAPVEVIRDPWGVPHIYATSQNDLFFAQGFVAA